MPGSYFGSVHAGAEVHEVRDEREVELADDPGLAEARDVDRGRERDVVAVAVVAELGVGHLDVIEQLVFDLDLVLLLERRDDVLADVVEPVVDDELGFGGRDRGRLCRRGGRRDRCGSRGRRRDRGRCRRRRRGRGRRGAAGGAGRDDRSQGHHGAERADPGEEVPSGHPLLGQIVLESLFDLIMEGVVSVGHGAVSSGSSGTPTGPPPRTSASDGDQVTATSLPTGSRIPALGVRTVRARPPGVRTWYEMVVPR